MELHLNFFVGFQGSRGAPGIPGFPGSPGSQGYPGSRGKCILNPEDKSGYSKCQLIL